VEQNLLFPSLTTFGLKGIIVTRGSRQDRGREMSIYVVVPLMCFAAYGALAVVALSRPNKMRVIFALYLIAGVGWSFGSTMAHLDFTPQTTYFWSKLLIITGWPMMVFYYHFVRLFTNKRPGWGVYLGYGIWLVLTVMTALGYTLKGAYFAQGTLYMDYGDSYNLVAGASAPFMLAAVFSLVQYYRTLSDPLARRRVAYLLAGIIAFFALAVTKLVPVLFKYPLDYVAGVINAILITYAILRYQLLDIKVAVLKGLVYSSLTVFLTAMYLLLLFILQMFIRSWTNYSSIALAAGFAILMAVLFNPLRDFLQRGIDRVFFREVYDYRQMLLNLSARVSNVIDLGELAQSILDSVVKALHVRQAALLFPKPESGDFTTQFVQQAATQEPPMRLRIASGSVIVTWLATEGRMLSRELIDIIPLFKGLWEVERVALNNSGVELLCPIRSKGKLTGILALGKKQAGTPYSQEEVDLLMTVANEAAVAMENARVLDSLRSEQLRVRRLLAQAVRAQEEERKRISVDLHDSVAQWLAAASYRVQTVSMLLSGDGGQEARDELEVVEQTVDRSLKELRRVVVGLRPPALDELGLSHALRQSLEELKAGDVECRFSEEGVPVRLPSNTEIAIYRVVQEALSNVRKHAGATKVGLRIQFQPEEFRVEIRDNGKGFDLSRTLDSAVSVGHVGLAGMRQRVETLRGDIKIETSEGMGTSIILRFPVQSQTEEG